MRLRIAGFLAVTMLTGAVALAQKVAPSNAPPPPRTLSVIATSDEHGWLDPLTQRNGEGFQGGMAYLYGQLLGKEGYRPPSTLLLSAGDMWTGPYESTLLQGRPMVQVMNSMGYDAAALGNHDFDFGQEALARRGSEASYPILAANLYLAGTKTNPPYVKPWAISIVDGIKVGIVGLVTTETPFTTDVRNLSGMEFGGYADALRREVPAVRAAGAQVVVVVAHADLKDLRPLASVARALGVPLIIGGHRHVGALEVDGGASPATTDDVVLCNPGPYARSYCKIDLNLDPATLLLKSQKSSIEIVAGNIKKPNFAPHEGVNQVIADARMQAEARGAEVLADVPSGLRRGEPVHTMGYLVLDAWMQALPNADFAVTNMGGFRQDIEPGAVKLKDVISAMPFDNYLVIVDVTGAQLREVLENVQSLPGGMTAEVKVDQTGKRTVLRVLDRNGKPLEDAKSYRVIINDFMYRGGDRYRFREYDSEAEETAVHWRDPLLRLLRAYGKATQPVSVTNVPRFTVQP